MSITDKEIADLVQLNAEANAAFISGDMTGYLERIKHAEDYTLMAPFGGAPTHGFDTSSERLAAMSRFFQAGETELDDSDLCVGQHGGAGGDRTAARRGRRSAGAGLVAAGHPGIPSRGRRVAVGPPSCRSARAQHQPGTGSRYRPRLSHRRLHALRPARCIFRAKLVTDFGGGLGSAMV